MGYAGTGTARVFAIAALSAVLCWAPLAPTAVQAQTLIGRTLEVGTDRALNDVAIELIDSTAAVRRQVLSDTAGWFIVRAASPGTYRLRATRIGYGTIESGALKLEQAAQLELEVRLAADAVALEPIRVVAERSYRHGILSEYFDRAEWTKRSGMGRIIDRGEIESLAPLHMRQLLTMYGPPRASCPMSYFLDGLRVSFEDIDMTVLPEHVEGIEIYRSAVHVPPQYARRVACGATLVWTRRDLLPGGRMPWRRVARTLGVFALIGLVLRYTLR